VFAGGVVMRDVGPGIAHVIDVFWLSAASARVRPPGADVTLQMLAACQHTVLRDHRA
jgi:hypothetical protein